MDEVRRLILELGEPLFTQVGGPDWGEKAHLGLETVAMIGPLLALMLALVALYEERRE